MNAADTVVQPECIPPELLQLPQWVNWRYDRRVSGDGEVQYTKVPVSPAGGGLADVARPETWSDFNAAYRNVRARLGLGLGFVFSRADPYAGLDLDNCLTVERPWAPGRAGRVDIVSDLEPWASELAVMLASYAEVSPSGRGIKMWLRADLPRAGYGFSMGGQSGHILAGERRFFTVTGRRLHHAPAGIIDRHDDLKRHLLATIDPPAPAPVARPAGTPSRMDPEAVVQAALAATNGWKFRQLFDGSSGGYASDSEADAALCGMIAFWTGPDEEAIEAVFGMSARVRPKWENRADYRRRTIAKGLQNRVFLTDARPAGPGQLSIFHGR